MQQQRRHFAFRVRRHFRYTETMKEQKQPKLDEKPAPEPTPFAAFDEFARKVMGVPKSEIDKREAEYQKGQAKKPKRGPKGK